jgi:hypothetical protein
MKIQGRYPIWERKESYFNLRKLYIEKYEEDFPEIMFNLDDHGSKIWPKKEHSMCYHKNQPERKIFCGPDWTFWHWPSSKVENSFEVFEKICIAGESKAQINKVAWFGNIKIGRAESPEKKTRPLLANYFCPKFPDRFDFHSGGRNGEVYMSMPEMTKKYSALLDIGGAGYSGRLKFLLFSNRPLLLVDREYVEYFHDDLVPFEHYIPVKIDLSDLLEKHDWILNNQTHSLKIAQKAKEFAIKNFTKDKILERLRFVFYEKMGENCS